MSLQNTKQFAFIVLGLLGSIILAGCQYHLGYGELSQRYSTISIPYVEGDSNGDLTNQIIKKLSLSGAFQYANEAGDLILKIKWIESKDQNIGFRYDRKRSGRLKKSLIPTETRRTATVELLLIDSLTQCIIRGPIRLTASVDFDHTYYSTRHRVNIFSLGQLNDMDAAREMVEVPLNERLAEKIIDYIVNSW